jgi:hypothetical protein
MSYRFIPGRQYLMPTHFGPMSGPRARPDGSRYPDPDGRIKESYSVAFLSDAGRLNDLLPEGFEIFGDPVVSVTFSYMTGIAWLAGRGYNMLGVSVPTRLRHGEKFYVGPFLLVLWENLTDPILTGRDQLGFNKVYCELPDPTIYGNRRSCHASWLGHVFSTMVIEDLRQVPTKPATADRELPSKHEAVSLLHLRYFPRVGDLSNAVVCEPVISPLSSATAIVEETLSGIGKVEFEVTRWEDMPTQFHIVERLRSLPIVTFQSATYQRVRGGTDHMEQTALV